MPWQYVYAMNHTLKLPLATFKHIVLSLFGLLSLAVTFWGRFAL